MNPTIEELTAAAAQEVKKRPEAQRLMTHAGVGPLTALAYVLIIGTPERSPRGKQIGTYGGMIPSEESSAGKQRLGDCKPTERLRESRAPGRPLTDNLCAFYHPCHALQSNRIAVKREMR